jgi:hypothetical protein
MQLAQHRGPRPSASPNTDTGFYSLTLPARMRSVNVAPELG